MRTDYKAHAGHTVYHETETLKTTVVDITFPEGWTLSEDESETNDEAYQHTAEMWCTECELILTGWK